MRMHSQSRIMMLLTPVFRTISIIKSLRLAESFLQKILIRMKTAAIQKKKFTQIILRRYHLKLTDIKIR